MASNLKNLYDLFCNFLRNSFSFVSTPPQNLSRRIIFILSPFVIVLTLLPIINIANIIATSGENNLSNDVVLWVDMVDKVLHQNLTLSTFLKNSFFGQHFIPIYMAIEMANAFLFDWNINITLFFAFFLNLIKLALLYDLFTFRYLKNPFRWLLLPFLSAMVFSNMEVTTFTGENTAPLIGLSVVGAVVSIWGIVRYQARIKGVIFSILGGLIASWTFALGLIVWPITLLGMILLGFRKVKLYITWFVGTLVCILPYLYFFFYKPSQFTQPVHLNLQTLFNLDFIVNMLGRPLVNLWTFDLTRQYLVTGAIGIVLAIACCIFFIVGLRRKKYSLFVPAILVIALGFGGVWMTSIGRTTLASWYITAAWPFWLGIVGFGFILLIHPDDDRPVFQSDFDYLIKLGGVFIFLIFVLLYARSNIGNEIYGFNLYSRTPASASCLRDYQFAPTYCEPYIFQWPMQTPELIFQLGRPLGKNQLSSNGRQQQWSLQGDYIFNRVEVKQEANTDSIGWYEGLNSDRISWSGTKRWHHLDVMLQSPNSIQWTVDFPSFMESAIFRTALGIHINESTNNPGADGLTFQITISGNEIESKTILSQYVPANDHSWTPMSYDLSAYRGKKVTIQFSSLPGENNIGDFAMFQYPVIDVTMAKHTDNATDVIYTPENTDLSPEFPIPGINDEIWKSTDSKSWVFSNLAPVEDKPGYFLGGVDPQFQLNKPVNLCLADYTHFYVKFAVPKGTPRVAQIFIQLNDNQPISEERSFSFTTFADGKIHMYTYPIRLLDLNVAYNAQLINVRFDPANNIKNNTDPIQFLELGLIRGKGSSICK
jgi:hypothetical protein